MSDFAFSARGKYGAGPWTKITPQGSMAKKDSSRHMLVLAKSEASAINNFRFGVYLSATLGQSIEDLVLAATADRFRLAQQHLRVATQTLKGPKPNYRNVLARAYYSMYHAARAVVYLRSEGDDYQDHSELPKHIPKDFPNPAQWENALKNARLERNRADYDPYPKLDRAFKASAEAVTADAQTFLTVAKSYLTKRGCKL